MTGSPHGRQVLGSLIAAVLLVIVTIAVVTARLGPIELDDDGGGGDRVEEVDEDD